MYRNFIFDLYGTLLDIRTEERATATWAAFADWLTAHGLPAPSPRSLRQRFQAGIRRLEHEAAAVGQTEVDYAPLFLALCRRLDPAATSEIAWAAGEAFRHAATRMIAPYPGTIPTLAALRKAGKRVFLLSNAQRIFTWRELKETGLLPYFDDVLISSDTGVKKPDPAFFRLLMDKHRLDARQSVMIGNDTTSDIAGAQAVGLDAVYLRTAISPKGDPTPDCRFVFEDGEISHVRELIREDA